MALMTLMATVMMVRVAPPCNWTIHMLYATPENRILRIKAL